MTTGTPAASTSTASTPSTAPAGDDQAPAVDMAEVRAFLSAALVEVRRRPWIQGQTRRESDGGVCAAGALFAAQVTARAHGAAYSGACLLAAHDALETAARDLTGANITVPGYNDSCAQNKSDIIRLFEKAITDCQ